MSAFYRIKLGEAVTFQRGFDITKVEQISGEVPIVSSSGISSTHNKSRAKGPGVVIGRKGTLGTVHFVTRDYWPHDTTLWVKNFKGSNPQFISYFLRTLKLENFDTGSSNPTLNRNHLHKIGVVFPKEPLIQCKIAAILTAYDDLIETNRRRIALLEKMAEEIYREWFVRMRFPGYQDTKLVKGVPEGWAMTKIEKAFEFTGGGTPSKLVPNYWNNGAVSWFTPSDITRSAGIFLSESEDQCSEEGLLRSSARLFPAYSVMMTSRATIGAIGINTKPACTNQGFITCIPNGRFPLPYLYQWAKLAKPYFEQLCGGATFPELTKGTFKKIEVLTPPETIVERFNQVSRPILTALETTLEENRVLTKTRDLLLPRLISGKLSVADLDIQFPPSMREGDEEAERKALDSTSESGQVHRR